MKLTEIRDEGVVYDNWREPTEEELKLEFSIKQKKIDRYRREIGTDIFDTWEKFMEAYNKRSVERISLARHRNIDRATPDVGSFEELENMLRGYAGWEFRKNTIPSLRKGYKEGDAIPMPLIIRRPDGSEIKVAGNTRMTVARLMNVTPDPKAVVIPG